MRTAFFRRASLLRSECLLSGVCKPDDPPLLNFTRFLLKCGEHTWGKDIKTFLGDTSHWSNAQLEEQLSSAAPNFMDVVASWEEQRDWCVTYALDALQGYPLAGPVSSALADLFPAASQPDPASAGFLPFSAGSIFTGGVWRLAFDSSTGSLSLLEDLRPGGRVWVNFSSGGGLAGTPHYTALSAADYAVFTGPEPGGYYPFPSNPPSWFSKDFGKPNVSSADPVHSETPASLQPGGLWRKDNNASSTTFLIHTSWATVNPALHELYGAPSDVWVELTVGVNSLVGTVSTYGKTRTRLPEGLYYRFNFSAPGGWRVGKLSGSVDPFDVVPGGNHHQHGFSRVVRALKEDGAALCVLSTDFAMAQFGTPIPLPAPVWSNSSSPSEGLSFLLIDNTWGTNYPAWVPWKSGESNMRWRFELIAEPPPPPPPYQKTPLF